MVGTTRRIRSNGSPPGRNTTGDREVTSTTVDSIPIGYSPERSMTSTFPESSPTRCRGEVRLGLPEMLALGAATGTLASRISLRATEWLGTLNATVSRPTVVTFGTSGLFGSTSVRARARNGPPSAGPHRGAGARQ